MGCMCAGCTKKMSWLLLVLAVAFLAVDLGWWKFLGLSGWTVVFLLLAFAHFGKSHCPECQKECGCSVEEKPKKKR